MSKNTDIFNKTNRNDRLKQMSQQQQLIEEKKRQIQKKIEDQRRREAEEAQRASQGEQLGSEAKINPNVFSNDGSFLDQFRKIANREGNDNQELKGNRDRSRSPINRNDTELHKKPFQQLQNQFEIIQQQRQMLMPQAQQQFQPHQFQQRQQLLAMASIPPPPPPPPMIPTQNIPAPSPLIPQTIPPPSPLNPHSIPPPKPMVPQSIPPPVPHPVMSIPSTNFNLPPALLTVPPPLPFNQPLTQVLPDNRGYGVLSIPQATQSTSDDFSQPPPITGVPPVSDQRNYPFPHSANNAVPKPEDCSYPLPSRNFPPTDTESAVPTTTTLSSPHPSISDVKNYNALSSSNNDLSAELNSSCEDNVESVANSSSLDAFTQSIPEFNLLDNSLTDLTSSEKFHPSSLHSPLSSAQQPVAESNLVNPKSNNSSSCGTSISQSSILPPPLSTAVPADNIQGISEQNLCKIEVKKEPEDPEEDSKACLTHKEKLEDFMSVPFIEAVKLEVKKEEKCDIQPASRPERKRKSRWGDSTNTETVSVPATTPTIVVPPSTTPKIKITGMSGYMISKVTRTDPGLLQYTRIAYGSTNLSEEDWKKAEDNYKVHLLYQDMMAKREQVEKLRAMGKNKYEYDSDEETDGGTWEHKLREKEMDATQQWAESLTEMAKGKHHIGDFLPPDELKRFMDKYSAVKGAGEPDLSDYKEFKLKEDNKGFQMLQKLGWTEGQGLGSDGGGILDPINKAQSRDHQGLGLARPGEVTSGDDEYDAYRKRMMLAYRFRPNPLNNPRRPYY